jgi:hypothetical protein
VFVRPINSLYHANYYQMVGFPHGVSLGVNADVDADVNTERLWPRGPYNHTTIDDEKLFHEELKSTFELKLSR